jgi:hypothetical protein
VNKFFSTSWHIAVLVNVLVPEAVANRVLRVLGIASERFVYATVSSPEKAAIITRVNLFCFGLVTELLMRTYHESQRRPIYRIRDVVGKK